MSNQQYGQDRFEGTESIPEMVRRHEKDLYRGNGKPGLTTRMERGEDRMADSEKRLHAIDTKFWAIILLLLSLLTAVIVDAAKGREQQQVPQQQPPTNSRLY